MARTSAVQAYQLSKCSSVSRGTARAHGKQGARAVHRAQLTSAEQITRLMSYITVRISSCSCASSRRGTR